MSLVCVAAGGRAQLPEAPAQAVGSIFFSGGQSTSGSPAMRIAKSLLNPGGTGTSMTLEGWGDFASAGAGINAQDVGDPGETINGYVNVATNGDIIWDADHEAEGSCFIVGLSQGRLYFGWNNAGGVRTIIGTTDLRGIGRRHWAVEYTANTGVASLYVDGAREITSDGPNGSVAWDGSGGSATDQRHEVGKEKLDITFGARHWASEIRVSNSLRYNAATYTVPTEPFETDANTLALYHMDEEDGDDVFDSSGNDAHGTLVNSPTRSTDDPF